MCSVWEMVGVVVVIGKTSGELVVCARGWKIADFEEESELIMGEFLVRRLCSSTAIGSRSHTVFLARRLEIKSPGLKPTKIYPALVQCRP